MAHKIRILAGDVSFEAELNDSPTAAAILAKLPLESPANRWGDEFYFSIPVRRKADPDARAEMEVGELAFWPPGNAFCIFFGRTPVSIDDRPRAANPANPVGRILGDVNPLHDLADGTTFRIEAVPG